MVPLAHTAPGVAEWAHKGKLVMHLPATSSVSVLCQAKDTETGETTVASPAHTCPGVLHEDMA